MSVRVESARLAVIGAGYVGLSTAVSLAHLGHRVSLGEVDPGKVARLRQGTPTIVEEGLAEILREGLDSGRLTIEEGAVAAVSEAEFVFLCLPTPQGEDGSADLSYLEAVAQEIGPHLAREAVVVNKSTVPVGSTMAVERLLNRPDVSVVSNPEFLREGSAIHDCLHPERIVVGADDPKAAARVGALFSPTNAPVLITSAASAETIKYASNAFLATKLSFVNSVATLCEYLGADVRDVLLGMAYDHRIGFDYLRPGPGWGGSCLPKDTLALGAISSAAGYHFGLLEAAIEANRSQLRQVSAKIRQAAGDQPGATVAIWGLTFKAGTDDLRDSPALQVVRQLRETGIRVRAYDPSVGVGTPAPVEGMELGADPYSVCSEADALALLTEWDEFRWVDFERVRDSMRQPHLVDARNLLDPTALRRLGFQYVGVGRP
jgi:UDPglucose 6-dehydrogenase